MYWALNVCAAKQKKEKNNESHSALTVPEWSPTSVLGEPNDAWLQSSDGIWYFHHGVTEWQLWI